MPTDTATRITVHTLTHTVMDMDIRTMAESIWAVAGVVTVAATMADTAMVEDMVADSMGEAADSMVVVDSTADMVAATVAATVADIANK